ncbi:hypothetical protein BAUCODRAFT_498575 [Baudoinia panamericana UAMH 10762]|uniref:Uncharacterized protein n=1 Tax=Baudoinia panamericana (strain UAMH 10762) TaxID=717646 RepID=M2N9Y8_BAUPA|nr:uncharacterized protein BAUCODRAFT_498575 [Baudoinia panamericana UAMH 10762]EMC95665.1 hypothetical protein BAUCODRAFT_498575 [Baudoinia panamericana UAMH 10762]
MPLRSLPTFDLIQTQQLQQAEFVRSPSFRPSSRELAALNAGLQLGSSTYRTATTVAGCSHRVSLGETPEQTDSAPSSLPGEWRKQGVVPMRRFCPPLLLVAQSRIFYSEGLPIALIKRGTTITKISDLSRSTAIASVQRAYSVRIQHYS